MKTPLIAALLLLPLHLLRAEAPAAAAKAEVGKPFPSYTLPDPHEQTHTLAKETRFVIITSEKDISGKVSDWLKAQPADYLGKHKTEVISDITPMPAIITSLFAKPKMKKYPYRLLLADDKKFAEIYPAKKAHIALFALDEKQTLTAIHYHKEAKEVAALIEAATPAPVNP